jgi:hypothetical protein
MLLAGCVLLLAGGGCADADTFGVQFVVTHNVRGAVWPVAENGTTCVVVSPPHTRCDNSCKGGAARRATALEAVRTSAADKGIDLITFDTGGFFFGGPLYAAFGCAASAKLMKSSNYSVAAADYRYDTLILLLLPTPTSSSTPAPLQPTARTHTPSRACKTLSISLFSLPSPSRVAGTITASTDSSVALALVC